MQVLSRLGFIGVGTIAEALIKGMCAGGEQRGTFLLSPRNAALSLGLARQFAFVEVAADNQAVVDGSDIVFLAVTPQVATKVLGALRFRQDQRIVSLIATYDVERLRPLVAPATSITRVAPVPPVARRLGPMIIYPPTPEVVVLLDGLGQLVQVQSESDMDALWAVTGIMAPYFGYLDAIASWLGRQNVPQSQARPFVAALFEALAVTAADRADDGFDKLRAAHTTPGGLNEQAHRELQAAGWMDLISRSLDLVQARMQGRATLEDRLPPGRDRSLPPGIAGWMRLEAIDLHTGGEPLRVFVAGLPSIEGNTVLEKRRYFRDHYDYIRTGTIWEPRGHADMYGAVLTPSSQADFDVFFLHNEGYSTMCGHAIIALTTLAVETGLARPERITFSVPAGLIEAHARLEGGKARDVSFRNVPCFAYAIDQSVDVPGMGRVRFDVAYGGAFYALVEAQTLGLGLRPADFNRLVDYGRRIKHAVMEAMPITHPFEPELSFLYGTIFTGAAEHPDCHSRNVCIFADGELDRSPTGSGVSARAALHYAKGELRLGERLIIESILGTRMTVQAAEKVPYGPYDAIVPEVGGTAFITGRSEFYFDPEDSLRRGFLLR